MRLDENSAECLVFTFKEGMLSAIAHDLKIKVGRFSVEAEGDPAAPSRLSASFEVASLRVQCAMKDGAENHDSLSDGDKKKIEKTIADEVLNPAKFAQVRFESTKIEGDRIEGKLTLHGVERPLSLVARREGSLRVVEVSLDQTQFGIKPYSAMMGTLRIKPQVTVRLSASWPG